VSAWRPDESNSLLEELARLRDQVGRFVGQRLDLVTADLRQGTQDTLRRTALVAVGAIGAAVGAMFLLLALGVWVGELIETIAGGLAMVGAGLTLVAGFSPGGASGVSEVAGSLQKPFARCGGMPNGSGT
jgi:hypothetical protein